MNKLPIIRQGDVLLLPVAKLPKDCTEVPLDKGRIVLAYGEATGHSHAIADHGRALADELTANVIARAQAKARLLIAPDGARYLDVRETVHVSHEEHATLLLVPGIYRLPAQMEYRPTELRRVAD